MSVFGNAVKYLNEGNVHVVISILNTDYVIRLIKEDGRTVKNMEIIRNSVNFVNIVMIPLLFGYYQYREEIIKLSSEDILKLSKDLFNVRPKQRRVKSNFSQFAIKAPNLTIISHNSENYCLEIKPKEGFMAGNFSRYSKCYYCLKQLLKLQENEVEYISSYCPLDLFSGDRKRMRKAILNLIKNPQNNLKLFKDGNIVYNEKSNVKDFEMIIKNTSSFNTLNIFLDLITEILLGDGISDIVIQESSKELNIDTNNEKCNKDGHLPANCFLHRLLNLQKLSEKLNLNSTSNEDFRYVFMLLKDMKELNINLINMDDRNKLFETIDPLYLAMISAVAKDCSIMVCLSPQTSELYPSITLKDISLSYKISVTDLEPKSIKSLTKRKTTEQMLIELYEKKS
ncbi:inositol-pentakisphosphate 2-kinase isoform X1 [Nymphalis io]|uniref:inositol-pentakisphosphate 2-kinase isoform X1 n=1 Tax=Inachis io TaxID=171585 RepID=UPI0021675C6B|nr:inositol-pentakisphosphate 2-kinase isoform X1 [Nymphalis io]